MRMKLYHIAGSFVLALFFTLCNPIGTKAQEVAVKSNLLYDAVLSPTVGVEVALAPQWTLDVSGTINAWAINDHRWKTFFAQPEARYWF